MPKALLKNLFVVIIVLLAISNGITNLAVGIRSSIEPAFAQSPSVEEEYSANPADTRGDFAARSEQETKTEPSSRKGLSWLDVSSPEDVSSRSVGNYSIIGSTSRNSTELIIGLDSAQPESYASLVNMIDRVGGKVTGKVSAHGKVTAVVANVPSNAMYSLSASIQASGLARYLEPNKKYMTQSAPNDRDWIEQWGPLKIQADWAWNTTVGNSSILVAVIDQRID